MAFTVIKRKGGALPVKSPLLAGAKRWQKGGSSRPSDGGAG